VRLIRERPGGRFWTTVCPLNEFQGHR
jgi:hypothetical protein